MEPKTNRLLSIRFASLSSERRELPSLKEGPASTACALLDEIPDWAPRQSDPSLDRICPEPVDHYESWQGICW